MGGIATISGVALVPGVSSNRRLYTPELIAKAAKRMQERIANPDALPIVMRTHHGAGDDSARIVGRVTKVTVGEDQSLRYEADLYDTPHGHTIASLVTPERPALRSVSIHGYWLGGTRSTRHGDESVTTADDLEIDAIDFTATPGVSGALIDPVDKEPVETADGRVAISESMEAQVVVTEVLSIPAVVHSGEYVVSPDTVRKSWNAQRGRQYEPDPVTEAKYDADQMKALLAKGHAMKNASGEPSYPIADKSDLAKAIKAVGRGKSGHDAIRKHIIKRARALGAMDMIPDNWNSDGSMKETEIRLGDVTEYYPDGPSGGASFCIDIYAGPLCVTLRGCVDPAQLRDAGAAAMQAALNAVMTMDPDQDADIDVGMDGMETSPPKVTLNFENGVIGESDLREMVQKIMQDLGGKHVATATEMTMAPDNHSHTHEMDGSGHVHAHKHDHPDESGGDGYAHSHTHGHVHASTDGPDHDHGHNHIHTTSSSATAESTQEEESAVSETTKAAEAAPERTLTEADLSALGAVVGESVGAVMAEAIRAMTEQTAPKHAAPTQETVEPVPAPVAESTQNADEVATLKASLAALQEAMVTQRKELQNQFRDEFLAEKGLPPRRGYRVSENDEQEEQLTQSELFDKYRADIMLGDYGRTPSPQA